MRLSDWLDRKGWTDQVAADAFGVARETARLYRHGKRAPREAVMHRISRATGGAVAAVDMASVPSSSTKNGSAEFRPRKRKV